MEDSINESQLGGIQFKVVFLFDYTTEIKATIYSIKNKFDLCRELLSENKVDDLRLINVLPLWERGAAPHGHTLL